MVMVNLNNLIITKPNLRILILKLFFFPTKKDTV